MENPTLEISPIIHALTRGTPSLQKSTLEKYFTPNASFTHPFCKILSFPSQATTSSTDTSTENVSSWLTSRNLILAIYQWYKLLSPRIDLTVESVAFDKANSLLYVSIRQHFRLWMVPFYDADVKLVTVLKLVAKYEDSRSKDVSTSDEEEDERRGYSVTARRYYIAHQEDLYQTDEWVKFIMPWGVGTTLIGVWQLFATFMCVIGAIVFYPLTLMKERRS